MSPWPTAPLPSWPRWKRCSSSAAVALRPIAIGSRPTPAFTGGHSSRLPSTSSDYPDSVLDFGGSCERILSFCLHLPRLENQLISDYRRTCCSRSVERVRPQYTGEECEQGVIGSAFAVAL